MYKLIGTTQIIVKIVFSPQNSDGNMKGTVDHAVWIKVAPLCIAIAVFEVSLCLSMISVYAAQL